MYSILGFCGSLRMELFRIREVSRRCSSMSSLSGIISSTLSSFRHTGQSSALMFWFKLEINSWWQSECIICPHEYAIKFDNNGEQQTEHSSRLLTIDISGWKTVTSTGKTGGGISKNRLLDRKANRQPGIGGLSGCVCVCGVGGVKRNATIGSMLGSGDSL